MAVRQMSGICPAVMLTFNKCVTTDASSTEHFLKSHDGSPSQSEDVRLFETVDCFLVKNYRVCHQRSIETLQNDCVTVTILKLLFE